MIKYVNDKKLHFRDGVKIIHVEFSNWLISKDVTDFLTPEPNGVGEGVYGIGRVGLLRRRRRRDTVSVWRPLELRLSNLDQR